jgi:hypothetical protein
VKTPTSPIDNDQVEPVEELIARVLGRAHRQMEVRGAPNEARGILHAAHSFADELSAMDPRFDRMRFMKEATENP